MVHALSRVDARMGEAIRRFGEYRYGYLVCLLQSIWRRLPTELTCPYHASRGVGLGLGKANMTESKLAGGLVSAIPMLGVRQNRPVPIGLLA
jgi:hypothetical protein